MSSLDIKSRKRRLCAVEKVLFLFCCG